MKALIVEDEPRAQRVLENLLRTNFPEVQVVGITSSVKETLAWLGRESADVIFLDVELSDGNCFDLFAQTEISAQVVMTTAYDNYAVKAFEVGSVDYLLKPIETEDLRRAVERVKARLGNPPAQVDFQRILESFQAEAARAAEGQAGTVGGGSTGAQARGRRDDLAPGETSPATVRPKDRFLIRLNDRIVPVHVHDIAYFHSEAKNTYIVTRNNRTYVLDDSLDTIETSLPSKDFFRISRSCIVAEEVIDSVSKLLGGRLRLSLKPGLTATADLTVSRARADAFLAWLEG